MPRLSYRLPALLYHGTYLCFVCHVPLLISISAGARKWFTISSLVLSPILFLIDAPFGRFSPSENSIFLVDGEHPHHPSLARPYPH